MLINWIFEKWVKGGIEDSLGLFLPRVDNLDFSISEAFYFSIITFDTVFLLTFSVADVHYLTFWNCIIEALVFKIGWASFLKKLEHKSFCVLVATNGYTKTKSRSLMSSWCSLPSLFLRSRNEEFFTVNYLLLKKP